MRQLRERTGSIFFDHVAHNHPFFRRTRIMNQLSTDEIIKKIDAGFPAVALAAIEKARQTKTKLVIWRDGAIVEIDPDEANAHDRSDQA
jgi:hypothetical protein